jgi:hypothetical protein
VLRIRANTSTANVLRSNSAQSTRRVLSLLGFFLVAASSATLAFSPAWGLYGLLKRYWDERG